MHDEENLYIGVTITNDDFQMVTDVGEGELYVDTLGIYFDGNNNGVIEPNEGINYFWWLGYSDWFFIEENRWTIDDVKNGTGKATHSNPSGIGDYVYEFEIPLDSGDPQDIAITSQSTVGIMVSFNEMYKENGDSINTAGQGGWPLFAEVRDGQTYGKLVLVD
jgi:hypothetical protein